MTRLTPDWVREKVYGCWLGKNCGGTLGTPLEKIWGEAEPFDVWWYPRLEAGGIPNDDLEMQLVWLKALEEVGPGLKAADLAQYWLDHIGYNWDEYGLNKVGLKRGLLPPVSGNYDNWFRDCMGCPIRSEIWACVAPGLPRLAAKYAYEDAICDHAGGESIYGELFNASMGSAAFVVSDLRRLVEIGRTYVPDDSVTAAAIDAALGAADEGLDWTVARRRVMDAAPHYNAQYSPINMGFQVVGMLCGGDFGDALCKTVNCGYDTDCTGATVGAILGVVAGRSGIPAKWAEPLGTSIATNESWGGLRDVSTCANPIARNLDELTERTLVAARRVLAESGYSFDSGYEVCEEDLVADDSVRELWRRNPNQVWYSYPGIEVGVDYLGWPVVVPGATKRISTSLRNHHPVSIEARLSLIAPEGWMGVSSQEVSVPAMGEAFVEWTLEAPAKVSWRNEALLRVSLPLRPALPATPIVLVGAKRLRVAGPFESDRAVDDAEWTEVWSEDDSLPFVGKGVFYVEAPFRAFRPYDLALWVPSTSPTKVWLDGKVGAQVDEYGMIRPSLGAWSDRVIKAHVEPGPHVVRMRFEHRVDTPFEAYLRIIDPNDQDAGIADLERS